MGRGRLDSKGISRSLLMGNWARQRHTIPRWHVETGLGDGVLLLLLLRMGKINRGEQREHELREVEGGGLSCSMGGLHGWRSLWSVERGTPLM